MNPSIDQTAPFQPAANQNNMTIEYDQPPLGKCPVQAKGRINGKPFYFGSCGGYWALRIAARPDGDVFADDALVHIEEYRGIHHARDLEINDGRFFAAGYAEEGECLDFIQRAATTLTAQ